MDSRELYRQALRLESDKIKNAINEVLGLRPASSYGEWQRILTTRDTASIQRYIDYWLGGEQKQESE